MGKRFGGATPSNSGDFLCVCFLGLSDFRYNQKNLGGVVVSGHNSSILLPET